MDSSKKQPIVINESETKEFRRVFEIPETKTLFNCERNPLEFDDRMAQWCEDVFQVSQMTRDNYKKVKVIVLFPVYFHPFCADVTRFENIIKIYLLFFVFDDHTECGWGDVGYVTARARQVWDQAIAGLDKVADPSQQIVVDDWKPYAKYWHRIVQNICQSLPEVSKRRLLRFLRDYCEANVAESEKIEAKHRFTDIEEMLKIRRNSIACNVIFALIEYSNQITLSDEEWADPLLQRMLLNATDAMIYNNDVASFEKEWLDQEKQLDHMINVVALTSLLEGIPIESAMKKMAAMSQHFDEQVFKIKNQLLEQNLSEGKRSFIEAVCLEVGGHYQTSLKIDRYNKIY